MNDRTPRLGLWLLGGSRIMEPGDYNALMRVLDLVLPNEPPLITGGTWRGAWSSRTYYAPLDCVVDSNGHTFVALQAGAGHTPASDVENWQRVTVIIGPPPLPRVLCAP